MSRPTTFAEYIRDHRIGTGRYETLRRTLENLSSLFAGRRVLDFGASQALSTCVLLELGAREVVGVEPELERVLRGREVLESLGLSGRATLEHVADTRSLPLPDDSFDVILANAVFEHIPQPRAAYVRELWRVLAPEGYLIINETPNKYVPKDYHTTGLWFVPWLPSSLARAYAIWRGRYKATGHWASSGWRGLGFFELVRSFTTPFAYLPERSRLRHRVLTRVGLPASLVDPYPTLVFRKQSA